MDGDIAPLDKIVEVVDRCACICFCMGGRGGRVLCLCLGVGGGILLRFRSVKRRGAAVKALAQVAARRHRTAPRHEQTTKPTATKPTATNQTQPTTRSFPGAYLFVDECHASGFLGATGRGTDEHCGVQGRVDVINSTLGKALGGATGGLGWVGLLAGSRVRGLLWRE